MQKRQTLAQKTWSHWQKIRDKFTENQWRFLLFCLVAGFILAFAAERTRQLQKPVQLEEQTKIITEEKKEAPKPEKAEKPQEKKQEPELVREVQPAYPTWPLEGDIVRKQGWFRSEAGDWRYHNGIDIGAPLGTKVQAARSGKIVEIGQDSTLGQFLKVESGDIITVYGHLSAVVGQVGESVKQGQVIAYSGESGASPGAALHFSVLIGGEAVDPELWLKTAH